MPVPVPVPLPVPVPVPCGCACALWLWLWLRPATLALAPALAPACGLWLWPAAVAESKSDRCMRRPLSRAGRGYEFVVFVFYDYFRFAGFQAFRDSLSRVVVE